MSASRSAGQVCQLPRRDLRSLDFTVSRYFMELFRTSDVSAIKYCQEIFYCELPTITLQRRLEKFETEHCDGETVLIKFVLS